MSSAMKYTIISLLGAAVISFALFFIIGGSDKKFTITFDSDGGSKVETQTVKKGEKVIKPADPTKEKYTFVAWLNGTEEYDFNKEVTSDLTLKAKWEAVIEIAKYDIIFKVNGEEKSLNVSAITEEDLLSLGFEEKDGYEIKWYLDGEEYDFSTPITANMTLEGKYVKIVEYTIKFNSDGGTKVENQKLKANETVKEPEAITKEGFIFDGWYLNNEKYDFSTPITKGFTLVAKWTEDPSVPRFEVKFDSDGGSSVKTQRIIENKTATKPTNPTKSGFVFNGWYLDGKLYDFKTKVTKEITLKAEWIEEIYYNVSFVSDGKTINTVKVKKGEKLTKPTDPKKDGYVFVEWLSNNNTYDFNKEVTDHLTLVARYSAVTKYTVSFDSDGGTAVSSQTVTSGNVATKPTNPTKTDNEFVEWQLDGKAYDFATKVTKDIKLKAVWKNNVNYTIIATKADNFSPDSTLTVYKNGSQISFRCIKFTDGVIVDGSSTCKSSASNTMVAQTNDISGESSFIVVLSDGSSVKATLK